MTGTLTEAREDGTGIATAPPLWLLRINPLRRSRLADPALRDALARLAEAERAVRSAAEESSDDLYLMIGSADGAEKKRLVEVRRSVHHDRTPKSELPDVPSLARWSAARDRREAARAGVAAGYPDAAERERGTLATLLGDEHLRASLALLAPEVAQEADRYRGTLAAGRSLSARARKSERGLLQYVTRAMVRTSPLSRFTAVGLAVPDPAGSAPGDIRFETAHAFPGLDRVMLAYVLGGLTAGAASPDAWVGLSPTSVHDAELGRLFVLRFTAEGFKRSAVAVTPPIKALLDAVSMGPRSARSVTGYLVDRMGCSPADGAKLVLGAVGGGVLCSYGEAEDGSADLDRLLTPADPATAGPLGRVRSGLSTVGTAAAAERPQALAVLGEDLAEVSRLARRPAQVTINEDYVLPPSTVDTRSWHGRLDDLGAGVELLSVFDWLHDVRVMTTDAFVERFGAGARVPLVEHADYLVDEVSRRTAIAVQLTEEPDPGPLSAGGRALQQLYALRREVLERTQAALTRTGEAGGSELRLAAGEARELVAGLPERFRRDPLSYGVLVQQAGDRLVLNDGLPGHGMLYSRFLDADRRLGGDALGRLGERLTQRYGWDGARVVEDLGLHRLHVNAHPQILADGLRPDDWFSLRLAHDPDTDTLGVQDADGRLLRVLAVGTGHPGLFPAPLSVASCLATGGRLNNYFLDTWHAAAPWDDRHTRTAPRISVGDVVIARRRWYGGAELGTALGAGPDEADRLLALTSWRARHDVPEEVVVKTTLTDMPPRSLKAAEAQPRTQKHKPQYVDLTSSLSTRVLPRMLERRAEDNALDYVEEALPGVVDDTNAAEWVVEIGRRPGGPFGYEGAV
jgi:hypothetical protein